MNSESASVMSPRAKTPIVCVTVVISPEKERMPRGAAGADQVRRDDRLAVAGAQGVNGSPEERDEERDDDEARAQVFPGDRLEKPPSRPRKRDAGAAPAARRGTARAPRPRPA